MEDIEPLFLKKFVLIIKRKHINMQFLAVFEDQNAAARKE